MIIFQDSNSELDKVPTDSIVPIVQSTLITLLRVFIVIFNAVYLCEERWFSGKIFIFIAFVLVIEGLAFAGIFLFPHSAIQTNYKSTIIWHLIQLLNITAIILLFNFHTLSPTIHLNFFKMILPLHVNGFHCLLSLAYFVQMPLLHSYFQLFKYAYSQIYFTQAYLFSLLVGAFIDLICFSTNQAMISGEIPSIPQYTFLITIFWVLFGILVILLTISWVRRTQWSLCYKQSCASA